MRSRHERSRPGASNMVKERPDAHGLPRHRPTDTFSSRQTAILGPDNEETRVFKDTRPRASHFDRQKSALNEAADARDDFATAPLLAGGVTEDGREPAYQTELLALFRQRLRLLAGIGLGASPAVVFISWLLMPSHILPIALAYTTLTLYCALVRMASPKLTSVAKSRLFVFSSYAFVCAVASSVLSLAGAHSELLYGGQLHIVLSVLLLPLALWECAIIGVMVNLSLSWAEFWSSGNSTLHLYTTHLFVMLTITAFVLCIAHMQDILRRRAFDATFDVMRSAAKLQALTFMDTLTGGFNRRYLDRMLRGEIARAIRFGRPLSVVMFDLDNFKRVNDTRGHSAGDEVLREVWQAAQITIREIDTLARYGGDEFSLVLPETDEEAALLVAERLQMASAERLRERFGEDAVESQVTLSVGITTVRPNETMHPDKILDNADARLYEAKRCGKNNIAA